ncbi:MAG TPA: S9 family peptidase [Blastocatellia bacterium]
MRNKSSIFQSFQTARLLAAIAAIVMVLPGGAIGPVFGRTTTGSATAGGRALGLADYYRVESATTPAISPDGRFVAFVRTYVIEAENRRENEIWLANADRSGAPRRLTDPAVNASTPRWSPDGKLLAYSVSRRPAERNAEAGSPIWFLKMDEPDSKPFQIEGVTSTPIFSPDNRWIAFTRKTPAGIKPVQQYASDFERKIDERFKGRIYDWMEYRFDQRGYLADPRDPLATPPEELYIVAREGGTPKQLTNLGVDVHSPAWRPDGSALAFTANTHQRDEYQYERADLWTVTLDGEIKRLTDDGYNHSSPAWSPDGQTLAFRRETSLTMVIAAKQDHGAAVDIYRMPASGGQMVNLTADWDLLPGEPLWSPDGNRIYFSGGIGGASHLFCVNSSGGKVEQVTTGDRVLGGFSISSAFDKIAYTATDSTHPAEVFCAGIDGSSERRLSKVSDSFIADLNLSPAQRVHYPSKDGTMIEGWVIPPLGYDPTKGRYPLIVSTHGGPHAAYGNEFDYQFQLWAARGYAVFYCNPRGSTGYGEKFLWATWGGWGTVDYDDVMAGVNYVCDHYPIDPKRMGITGYSYGGFLTNWIITQTTRFAAAVVGAGISNWVTDYGTADIPRTKESEFYGPPWEPKSNALLIKFSPITYVAHVTTPTLFVHGESDMRVPIEEGEQMYRALTKRHVPARFIRYPESFHGGWTPWNTLHRYYHELQWWDEYLGGPSSSQAVRQQAK